MWRNVGRKLLGLAVIAANVIAASCHGFMSEPAARNVVHNSDSCPHCWSAGGPSVTYSGNRKWSANWDPKKNAAHGVCGDPVTAPAHHEAGGKFATKKITGVYARGQTITLRVKVTAPHGGRFIFGICPVPDGASDAAERAAVTQQCMDRNRLKNAQDGTDYWWFGKKTTGEFEMQFKLPDNIECKRCVLQWHYETGNSCTLPGTPPDAVMGGGTMGGCEGNKNIEEFWNCADVTVLPKGAKVPDPPKKSKQSAAERQGEMSMSKALRDARRMQANELRAQANSLPKGPIRDAVMGQVKMLENIAAGGAGEGYANQGGVFDTAGMVAISSTGGGGGGGGRQGWRLVMVVALVALSGMAMPLALAVGATVGLLVWTLSAAARQVAEGYPRAWPLLEALGPRASAGVHRGGGATGGGAVPWWGGRRLGVYEPPNPWQQQAPPARRGGGDTDDDEDYDDDVPE